jgi:hypothetical protein
MPLPVDYEATEVRRAAQHLYGQLGVIPVVDTVEFGCAHLSKCRAHSERVGRAFHAGDWLYVGPEYGKAMVAGFPIKILFVAMDRGGGPACTDFAQAQSECRDAAENPANPHMGGVALIMARLAEERDPGRRSLQFALTNAVKCVEGTGNMKSTDTTTSTMITNCGRHLRAELEVLQPHLIVTQGDHPRRTVMALMGNRPAAARFDDGGSSCEVFLGDGCVVVTTPHPARHKGLRWKQGVLPNSFEQALSAARGQIIELREER